jgi:hypothetical protein
MGISPQGDPCPRHPLVKRSQPWSSLCPPLVLCLPPSRVDHIPTSSALKLGGRLWSTKPDSVPKISPNCRASNEELKHLRGIRLDSLSKRIVLGQTKCAVPWVKTVIGVHFRQPLPKGCLRGCSGEYRKVSEQGYCLAQRGWPSTSDRATGLELEICLWCRR